MTHGAPGGFVDSGDLGSWTRAPRRSFVDRASRPSLALRPRLRSRGDELEIRANRAGAVIALGGRRREQLADDCLQPDRTAAVERLDAPRSNPLFETPRVGGAERRRAADHLVEQHANRPEV